MSVEDLDAVMHASKVMRQILDKMPRHELKALAERLEVGNPSKRSRELDVAVRRRLIGLVPRR